MGTLPWVFVVQDSYLEAAFSEEQLLTVPMVPEGTEYQAQCVLRILVGSGGPGGCAQPVETEVVAE